MNLLLPITNTLSCPPSNPCLLAPCQFSPTAAPTVPLCSSGCHGCHHMSSFLIPPPPARARLLSAVMPAGLIKGFLFSPRAAPDPKAHSCDGKGAGHISSMFLLHQEWDHCCPGATAALPLRDAASQQFLLSPALGPIRDTAAQRASLPEHASLRGAGPRGQPLAGQS